MEGPPPIPQLLGQAQRFSDAHIVPLRWRREQLPEAIRDLVLDDRRLRNDICWSELDFKLGKNDVEF